MKLKFKTPSPALVISCFALVVALGPVVRAANTVGTDDIIDLAVTAPKLAGEAVTAEKIAPASVTASKLADNAVALANIKGADDNVRLTVNAGSIPDGRCKPFKLIVPAAKAGEVVLLSLKGSLQPGVFIYGTQVLTNGRPMAVVCNMSGTTLETINKLVRVVTIG
jgi:hypothetical protein